VARKKTVEAVSLGRVELSRRLRAVRVELYGERGGADLARRLGISPRSWYNYEVGVTVPGATRKRWPWPWA
jgi:hypothetical protein